MLAGGILACSSATEVEPAPPEYSYVLTETGRTSVSLAGNVAMAYTKVFIAPGVPPGFSFVLELGDSLIFGALVRDSLTVPSGAFRAAYFGAPGEVSTVPRHRRVSPVIIDSSSRITIEAAPAGRVRGTFRLIYPPQPLADIGAIEIIGRFDVPRGPVRRG